MRPDFLKRIDQLERARRIKLEGGFNSIPFGIPELDRFHPGLVKGSYYCITGNSGSGKTQTGKWLIAQQPYRFITEHPEVRYKLLWFALEESNEQFIDALLLNHMHRETGSFSSMNNLNAYGEFDVLSDEQLAFLRSEKSLAYYERLREVVHVFGHLTDYRRILAYIYRYALKHGTFMYRGKPLEVTEAQADSLLKDVVFDSYEPDDPDEYVVIVIDHISLVTGGGTLFETMRLLSNKLRMVGKLFNYIPVAIHQQAKEQSANIERFKFGRMLPDASNLADNKALHNDYLEVFGVFQPHASQLETFTAGGYEFPIAGPEGFGNRLSFLVPLKSRFGGASPLIPMIFYGEVFMYYPYPSGGKEKDDYLLSGPHREHLIELVRERRYLGRESLSPPSPFSM